MPLDRGFQDCSGLLSVKCDPKYLHAYLSLDSAISSLADAMEAIPEGVNGWATVSGSGADFALRSLRDEAARLLGVEVSLRHAVDAHAQIQDSESTSS